MAIKIMYSELRQEFIGTQRNVNKIKEECHEMQTQKNIFINIIHRKILRNRIDGQLLKNNL